MLKKIVATVILLCVMLSMNAMAENTNGAPPSSMSEAMSQETVRGGNRLPSEEMPMEGVPSEMQNRKMPTDDNRPVGEEAAKLQGGDTTGENWQAPNGSGQFGGQMPPNTDGFPWNMQGANPSDMQVQEEGVLKFVKTNATPILSIVLLMLAFFFVIFYKRKNY